MCYRTKLAPSAIRHHEGLRTQLDELWQGEVELNGFNKPLTPIIADDNRNVELARWGFTEDWVKSGVNLNTRWDKINSNYWREYKHNHCLIIVNGFYEWKWENPKDPKSKKSMHLLRLPEDEIFMLLGIYRYKKYESGEVVKEYSILTTEAQGIMREIHNSKLRMPWSSFDPNMWRSYLNGGAPVESEYDYEAIFMG